MLERTELSSVKVSSADKMIFWLQIPIFLRYSSEPSSRTNILLGPKSSTVDKDACLSVQLPSGDLRDELNLVDNPSNLRRKVYLRGDIVEAYFAIPGIKNISEHVLP